MRRAEARAELADRMPARPWSELVESVSPGTLDGFGGPLDPKWNRVRFIDAANMATGFGGVGTLVTNPNGVGDDPDGKGIGAAKRRAGQQWQRSDDGAGCRSVHPLLRFDQARAFPYSASRRLHAFSACGSL